jgi:5'-AMP-activated protein kinase catalytic alpha subunit
MKENLWFKKDFKEIPWNLSESKQRDSDSDSDDESTASSTSSSTLLGDLASPMACPMHTSVSAPSLTTLESTGSAAVEAQPHMRRPKSLNAFDIIASSPSLDLSGLFQDPSEQMRFVSTAPVSKIISKLKEIAGHVSFTARTKEYQVSIEETRNGNQDVLLISAKIFELTPKLVMVKVCKKAGDITQYRQFCNNELKPGLRGLIDGLPEDNGDCCMASISR